MDAGRGKERGREGWPDRPRFIASVTSPLGATTPPRSSFFPPPPLSPFIPPFSHLYSFYSPVSPTRSLSCHLCLLASPAVCLFLGQSTPPPPSAIITFLLPCFLPPLEPLLFRIYNIYPGLDVSLICCPSPLSVLYLSFLSSPALPLSSTPMFLNLFLSL